MYKIIWAIALLTIAQCKTNKVDDAITLVPSTSSISTDTTIIEEKHVYRGDTLITSITMVGDTILEKSTSKYGLTSEGDMMTSDVMRRSSSKDGSSAVMYEKEMSMAPATSSAKAPPSGRIVPDRPQNLDPGQITAGEWNDLNNWEDWKNLLNDNDYFEMQNHWGIYPTKRYSVFVTNSEHNPIADLKVELIAGSEVIWKARTDNGGKAELWSGLLDKKSPHKSNLKAKIYHGTDVYNLDVNEGKSSNLTIDRACNTADKVDIMFVVDATGSMGDEIDYLKSEVKDVIKRSTQNQNDLDLRIGSVFYRDMNDAYLTKVSPLSSNLDRVYNFINNQSARGGGDFPEAVDAGLDEALAQQWSENAVAKIIFLLLDAPPHNEDQIKTTIRDQIAEAAERGIKIIPISASGISRETEFLLKYMSISTNGTYVFITDDSGIGNPHLDPLVDDFEVEKLNDLLTRLITHYTLIQNCNVQAVTNNKVKIYPNPTSNFINVESKLALNEIRVISNSGKVVHKVKNVKYQVRIDLSFLVDGVYTVQCLGSDFRYSYPVILVSE